MAPAESQKIAATKQAPITPERLPPVVPMTKHPWLLAVAIVCFTSWLLFLLAMAFQP